MYVKLKFPNYSFENKEKVPLISAVQSVLDSEADISYMLARLIDNLAQKDILSLQDLNTVVFDDRPYQVITDLVKE